MLVNRYGEELEYDLHAQLAMDLLDFFRGRYPWDKLIRLAEQLPAWSRYRSALADDDEMAERLLAEQGDEDDDEVASRRRRHLTYQDWTPERELLTAVAEAVRDLHATLAAVNSRSGKRKDPPPLPRPRSAAERVKRRRAVEQTAAITQMFSPKEG